MDGKDFLPELRARVIPRLVFGGTAWLISDMLQSPPHFSGEYRMTMSSELMLLAVATMWGFIQLVAAAQAANIQYGLKWAASPRDVEMPPFKPIPGRISRNFRNYMETFPFFAAAVLVADAAGIHNQLTLWGSIAYIGGRIVFTALYISGVPIIRSLFWNVAAFGMLAVLVAPFASQ